MRRGVAKWTSLVIQKQLREGTAAEVIRIPTGLATIKPLLCEWVCDGQVVLNGLGNAVRAGYVKAGTMQVSP